MMPSPPIDDRIDTRPSARLAAGQRPGLRQYTRLVRSRVANLLTHHALHSFAPTRLPLLCRKPIVTSAPLQPPHAIPRGQIPIAPAAPPLPHRPRFRALALFGRRPPERVERFVLPAAENLHTSGCEQSQQTTLYSITSSARSRKDSGIASLRALAVVRSMTSSNLVGCSTGRSAGFAPLRILSTYSAERRNRCVLLAP